MAAAGAIKKLVMDVAKTVSHFDGQTVEHPSEKKHRSERKPYAKSRRELYQQNKTAEIKCSIYRTYGHSNEQCFNQKAADIYTVEEETAQEEIVTPRTPMKICWNQ